MTIYAYLDFRDFLRDRIDALRRENTKLSIREILRRVQCASPSYYKEVVIDGRKKMSLSAARRFAAFLKLSADETVYLLLLVQYNQAASTVDREHFYGALIDRQKKPAGADHFLTIGEYGYMAEWYHTVIRELLPLLEGFGNRSAGERRQLASLLRVPLTDRQIDEAITLLEELKFIRKNSEGNYEKSDTTIRVEQKSPAAYQALCRFLDVGKSVITSTDPLYRLFKVAVLGTNRDTAVLIEKKINEVCQEIVQIAGASESDRLYALNIQFFPLTKLPEETG
ncbi:MAG: TIGR02147 family protein [Chitinispirillaceae bacterium]|nr:TIGR02147 family protein [Chitinispirillaceae bacterium]